MQVLSTNPSTLADSEKRLGLFEKVTVEGQIDAKIRTWGIWWGKVLEQPTIICAVSEGSVHVLWSCGPMDVSHSLSKIQNLRAGMNCWIFLWPDIEFSKPMSSADTQRHQNLMWSISEKPRVWSRLYFIDSGLTVHASFWIFLGHVAVASFFFALICSLCCLAVPYSAMWEADENSDEEGVEETRSRWSCHSCKLNHMRFFYFMTGAGVSWSPCSAKLVVWNPTVRYVRWNIGLFFCLKSWDLSREVNS